MRILIDLQGAQATHRGRGIGRYSLSFAKALVRQKGIHEIQLLLNGHFPQSVNEIKQVFFGSLPASHVHVWMALDPINDLRTENHERRGLAHQVRQAIIDAIAPDLVLLTSLFEDPGNSGLVDIDSDGPPVAVVLYDLIPLVHQDTYLTDPTVKDWYFSRLEELRKANTLLAISEYSRQEAIRYLNWDADKIANISAACDDIFSPLAFPQFLRHISLRSLMSAFELKGAELIEMLVASNSIVETLDVIEDVRLGFSPSLVNPLLDLFALQITEERFSHRVIPAVTSTTHAWTQSVVFAPTVEFIAAKLAALIRMDDHRVFWPSAPHRHRQCIQYQAGLHARAHAPAHHRTRVQI